MQIFISWSKEKSRKIAEAMNTFLEGLFHDKITIWLSSEKIPYGAMPTYTINEALGQCDKIVACFTEDNFNASWIMYEIGVVTGRNHKDMLANKEIVFPVFFENVNKEKIKNTPIGQFQILDFGEISINKLVYQINESVKSFSNDFTLQKQFQLNWREFKESVESILNNYSIHSDNSLCCDFLIQVFNENKFPIPDKGDIIRYQSGFETQKFYDILLSNADKRLWIYGRKNRKLFANDHRFFFEDLKRKIDNGFDFKCLFVNPEANDIVTKAQKSDNFLDNLRICIQNAKNILHTNGVEPQMVCKLYSSLRTDEIIVIDNAVLFSHIYFDEENYPLPLTKAAFSMADIENQIGKRFISIFSAVWEEADYL